VSSARRDALLAALDLHKETLQLEAPLIMIFNSLHLRKVSRGQGSEGEAR
jgi:hypothetical protein